MSRLTRLLIAIASAVVLVGCVVAWYASGETLPRVVRIAAGQKDGLYDTFAHHFARHLQQRLGRPVQVVETAGTEENLGLLDDGGAELALVQTDAVLPEGVVGVAPLFPEPLHFLARKGAGIDSVEKLAGKRVALGRVGSGMRRSALALLAHHELEPAALTDAGEPFAALEGDEKLDAAFVTTGWLNPRLGKLLQQGEFELVGIPDAAGLAQRHPWFTAATLPRGLYPGKPPVPLAPVPTVAVTALLVARSDAPQGLVRESLAALYETDLRAAFPSAASAKAARDFDAVVLHPAVAEYHDPYEGMNRLSGMMDFFSKFKEVLLAVVAVGFLLWNWARLRRERAEAQADQAQKDQLEGFIGLTLEVELEQMEVEDPEELRSFLRRVTQIKQQALRELTSERVRADQLFAIFLAQCAALSEKIQMRMLYGKLAAVSEPPVPGG